MTILCLIGKSGSGKSTLEQAISKFGYSRVISYTTREKRENEVDGVDYNFVSKEQFEGLVRKNLIMEYAEYAGNLYGTPRPIGGVNHVAAVEIEGYRRIKEMYGTQAVGVYLEVDDETRAERLLRVKKIASRGDLALRAEADKRFDNIGSEVDLIINAADPLDDQIKQIVYFVQSKKAKERKND